MNEQLHINESLTPLLEINFVNKINIIDFYGVLYVKKRNNDAQINHEIK